MEKVDAKPNSEHDQRGGCRWHQYRQLSGVLDHDRREDDGADTEKELVEAFKVFAVCRWQLAHLMEAAGGGGE